MHTAQWRAAVFSGAVILYLIYRVTGIKGLELWLAILSVAAIVLSFFRVSLPSKGLTAVFLGLGTWFLLKKGVDPYTYLLTYGEMLSLLSFFALIPLLALPIQIGKYDLTFGEVIGGNRGSDFCFYRTVSSLSYLLGSFLNLGAIPILYGSIGSAVSNGAGDNKKFMANSIIHGYALPIMWTPMSGIVSVVFDLTKLNWLAVFPLFFSVTLVCLLANWLLFWTGEQWRKRTMKEVKALAFSGTAPSAGMKEKGESAAGEGGKETAVTIAAAENPKTRSPKAAILQILLAIVLLIAAVIGCKALFSYGLVLSVALLSLPVSWVWALLLKRNALFWLEVKRHFKEQVPKMTEVFAVFLSAGFFAKAMQTSGADQQLNDLFVQFNHWIGSTLFLILLPLLTLMMSSVGLHPVVTVTLLAQSLNPSVLGIPDEKIAMALLGGAFMGFAVAPYSGTITLMSTLCKESIFKIAWWNVPQAGCWFLILALFLLYA